MPCEAFASSGIIFASLPAILNTFTRPLQTSACRLSQVFFGQQVLLSTTVVTRGDHIGWIKVETFLVNYRILNTPTDLFPDKKKRSCAPSGIRTHTEWILSPLPLPIGL